MTTNLIDFIIDTKILFGSGENEVLPKSIDIDVDIDIDINIKHLKIKIRNQKYLFIQYVLLIYSSKIIGH